MDAVVQEGKSLIEGVRATTTWEHNWTSYNASLDPPDTQEHVPRALTNAPEYQASGAAVGQLRADDRDTVSHWKTLASQNQARADRLQNQLNSFQRQDRADPGSVSSPAGGKADGKRKRGNQRQRGGQGGAKQWNSDIPVPPQPFRGKGRGGKGKQKF